MNFSEGYDIYTERLLLRSPRMNDREDIFFMRTDASINKFIKRQKPKHLSEVDVFIKDRLKDRREGRSIYWAITLKTTPDTYIGAITLWNFSKDRQTAELGYDLHPRYQGKGIMSEAMATIVSFGFSTLQLQKIEAYTHYENKASIALLKKNLFTITDKKDPGFPTNVVYQRTV